MAGRPKRSDRALIGVAAQEGEFEEVVEAVDHGGQGNGRVDGEKEGHHRQQQRPQAEAGKQRQAGGQEGAEADDEVVHSDQRSAVSSRHSPAAQLSPVWRFTGQRPVPLEDSPRSQVALGNGNGGQAGPGGEKGNPRYNLGTRKRCIIQVANIPRFSRLSRPGLRGFQAEKSGQSGPTCAGI